MENIYSRRIIIRVLQLILIICLPLAVLLTTVEYYALDADFYVSQFEKYAIADNTGIASSDLLYISERIADYFSDTADNLDMRVNVNGNLRELFNDKEKQHMLDVKNLMLLESWVNSVCIVASVISLISLWHFREKPRLLGSVLIASLIALGIVVALAVLIWSDFSTHFDTFHEILFTNDLWLLNPKTDILIQMMPLNLFYYAAVSIFSRFGIIMAALGLTAALALRKTRKIHAIHMDDSKTGGRA